MIAVSRSSSLFTEKKSYQQDRKQSKVLLVANTGWYLYNFRLSLAKEIRRRGTAVVFVSPWDPYVEKIKAEGFWWIELDMNRRSTNPLLEMYALFRLFLIYMVESPDIVHHFTIKCVLYGTLAAKLSRTKHVVNAITGLGYVFINKSVKARIIKFGVQLLYFFVLNARRCRTIFQNNDDFNFLVNRKLVSPKKASLIRSSGVDLQRFKPQPSPSENTQATVLLASRIVGDKGVYEYVEAAKKLRAQGYDVIFKMAGALYSGNPSAICEDEVSRWTTERTIDWIGHVDNIETVIAEADIVVLPSHGGEGVPKILIEAAAMAKPLVATDVPGCRDAVKPGVNGFLVPVKDAACLSAAIQRLVDDPSLRHRMGSAGRKKVAAEFDLEVVIEKTLEVYREMMTVKKSSSTPLPTGAVQW